MTSTLDDLARSCADVRPGEPEEGVLGVVPAWVATPATVAEASEVMRTAARLGLAMVPRGGESRLDWGNPPTRCDLLIDTRRLDRIVEHAAGDLVVKAEAGVPLERLAEELATHGQRLALDIPIPGSTVGGMLATGAAGPLRLLYGRPRDLVIGITVIRADGEVTKSGGKVVKNVAGYDLGKLFAGSYGTLGLIVEATFRLHPVPKAHAYVTAGFDDPRDAEEAMRAALHSAAVPSAVEVDAPPGGPITLGALLEGTPGAIAARTNALHAVLETAAAKARTARDASRDAAIAQPGAGAVEGAAASTAAGAVEGVAGAVEGASASAGAGAVEGVAGAVEGVGASAGAGAVEGTAATNAAGAVEGVGASGGAGAVEGVRAGGGAAMWVGDEAPVWWGRYPDGTTLIELAGPRLLADLPWSGTSVRCGDPEVTAAVRLSGGAEHGYAGLPADTPPAAVAGFVEALRAALEPGGGGAVVRYAPEAVRDEIDLWGPVPAIELMRRVKDQFDPERRMSPGRFAGGI